MDITLDVYLLLANRGSTSYCLVLMVMSSFLYFKVERKANIRNRYNTFGLRREIFLKVTCEKIRNSNCDFYNNFRDNECPYI